VGVHQGIEVGFHGELLGWDVSGDLPLE